MLEFAEVNYWAVIVVWIIYMVVGAYWYSGAGFAKQWTKHTGVDLLKLPQDVATKIIGFVALSALVQSITLAVILASVDVTNVAEGLAVGLLLWLGLVTATTVGTTLYAKRSWRFLWLSSAYFLVVMLVGSLIFSLWR